MVKRDWQTENPDDVLHFWFPEDGHQENMDTHGGFWKWRMQGLADEPICKQFAGLTEAGARGLLDHWAETPRGRLALIIVLDQFSRSLWRGRPGAYAQDIKSARLALEGLQNGHYDALPNVWEKQFIHIAISHCEGPDHLQRMDSLMELARKLADEAPAPIRLMYLLQVEQTMIVRDIVRRFGRHPHRNAVLGRMSTVDEEEYINIGEFPHERRSVSNVGEVEKRLARAGLL